MGVGYSQILAYLYPGGRSLNFPHVRKAIYWTIEKFPTKIHKFGNQRKQRGEDTSSTCLLVARKAAMRREQAVYAVPSAFEKITRGKQ